MVPEAEEDAPAEGSKDVALTPSKTEEDRGLESKPEPSPERSTRAQIYWILWAALLARTFKLDVLKCSRCNGRMRVIAAVMKADVVAKILGSLGHSADAPVMRSARAPPDQGDPTEADLVEIDWNALN